ncbi:MAG: ABC transporter ATP-binding protein [Lachnospiraceae bacterium]|nr:ABC transporter ATP-binding protein [Lachnospiraceae bacterium]
MLCEEDNFLKTYRRNKGHSLRTLISLYKGNYLSLIASSIFFIIKHSPVWILPIATANIINAATVPSETSVTVILFNVILMIVMNAQNVLTNYFHVRFYSRAIRNVEAGLRCSLVRKLQQLSIPYHNKMQSGRLQSKIMRDVEQVQTLSHQLFISLLSITMNIAVALAVVITKSIVVFVFFLFTVPVAACIIVAFRSKIRTRNSEFRKEMEETSARVMEMVELIPVTRAHGLEAQEIHRMQSQLTQVANKGYLLDVTQGYFSSISWVAFQIFQVICLGFTGYLAYKGSIKVGDVVLYQSYFTTIVNQVSNIITLLPTISKGLESVNSIGDVLLAHDIEDNRNKIKLSDVTGDIVFQDVSFRYQDSDHDTMHHFNFHAVPGETIALVGGSGAGKTTILNMIIGFITPTSGHVLIDGHNMADINLPSYRSHLAVVPQNSILFTGTIRENITYGLSSVSDEELMRVIEAANLTDLIESLPEGLDTRINEHGSNLSGGQRQRISIARALIRNPRIIILDEATSALDSISEKKVQEAISNLVKNRTTFIVAHRLSTIQNADRIAVINQGACTECGTYEELMKLKGEFYELKKLQS